MAKILSDQNANVIGLVHDQFKAKDRLNGVVLEVTCETNGNDHIQRITDALHENGFEIHRQY